MRRPKVPHVLLAGSDDVWKMRRAAAAFLRKLREYLAIDGPYHIMMGTDADSEVLGLMHAGKFIYRVRRIAEGGVLLLTVSKGQSSPPIVTNLRDVQSWQFEVLTALFD